MDEDNTLQEEEEEVLQMEPAQEEPRAEASQHQPSQHSHPNES